MKEISENNTESDVILRQNNKITSEVVKKMSAYCSKYVYYLAVNNNFFMKYTFFLQKCTYFFLSPLNSNLYAICAFFK